MQSQWQQQPLPYSDSYQAVVDSQKLVHLCNNSHQRWQYIENRTICPQLAASMHDYNQRLGAPGAVLSNIRALEAGAAVVIGGQQPYPLGGPLFLLYKALMTIKAAQILSEKTARTVVPVFWVHSDDHDYEEIRTVTVWTTDDKIIPITWPAKSRGQLVGELSLTEHITGFMAVVRSAGFSSSVADLEPGPACDIGKWQARVLLRLCGVQGLIMFDPRLQPARKQAASVLLRCAERSDWSQLINLGLESGHSCLFYHGERGREAIMWNQDQAVTRSRSLGNRSQLMALIHDQPQLFSPNVAVRPFVQDDLFPVAAVVSGPGEAAYLPELELMEDHMQQQLAPILPRLSLTIVDPEANRMLVDNKLTVADLVDYPRARDHLLQPLGLSDIETRFDDMNRVIDEQYEELQAELPGIDQGVLEKNRHHVRFQLQYLLHKVKQGHRKQHKQVLTSLAAVRDRMWPDGAPQERTLSTASYIARWGTDLVTTLLSAPADGQHRLLFLNRGSQS